MPLINHILPHDIDEKLEPMEREILHLVMHWISTGITQGNTINDQRPVITSVMNEPVLMIESRQWSAYAQTRWWRSHAWGGQNTHPIKAMSEIISQVSERHPENA